MSNELEGRVEEALLQITNEGESYTFDEIVKAVAEEGDCLNCLEGPVRKALIKLMVGNRINLSLA